VKLAEAHLSDAAFPPSILVLCWY